MKNHYRSAVSVLLVVLLLFSFTSTVFAVIADGQVVKKEEVVSAGSVGIWMHHIDGTNEALYCIDASALSPTSFTIPAGSTSVDPIAYWNALPPATQQALRIALLYAPKTYTDATKYQCAAAQVIVWEYINGIRALDNYQTYPLTYAGLVTGNPTMYTAYQTMIQKIQRHSLIPTINGDTVTVTGLGEANAVLTLYDGNSILANDWEAVSPDSRVHVEIATNNGVRVNRLKVWLSEDIGDTTVTVNLKHKGFTDIVGNAVDPRASTARWIANYPYNGNANAGQPMIGGTLPDPLSAKIQVNANLSASLEIVKESPDGHVRGIDFIIEKFEPNGIGWWKFDTYTTDAAGKVLIDGLTVGERLKVTEIVPDSYICESDNPQEITLTAGTNRLTFLNKPQSSLELYKESDDGQIEGLSFTVEVLQNQSYVLHGRYTTDAEGRITLKDLIPGKKYRVTETVPEGYINAATVQTFTALPGTNYLRFENRLIRGSLHIVKVDKATKTPLQGAGYRLYSEEGRQLGEGYTNENGELIFENLAYGSYTYQEFSAPEGFALDNKAYDLVIREDGVEIVRQQENQPKEGSIKIFKTDENDRPLSGVTFLLEFSVDDGDTWSPIALRSEKDPVQAGYCTSKGLLDGELITGADGYATFTGLCPDTQVGDILYRITEVSTKPGYSLLTGYAFEGALSEQSGIDVSFTVVNQPEFTLPSTGGSGFTVLSAIAAVLGIAAGTILLLCKKKSED